MNLKFPNIVDRYILKEIISLFFVSVIIITIIMLSSFLFELTDMLIIKNIPLKNIILLLVYKIPEIIVNTFPIAILFAVMNGLGKLNSFNEILAFRMGGISIYRLLIPLLILGLILSGLIYILNEYIIPESNHKTYTLIRKTMFDNDLPYVEENVFFKDNNERVFFVSSYNQKENIIYDVMIYNLKDNNFPSVITATKGIIEDNVWVLNDGIIHNYNEKGHMSLETSFDKFNIDFTYDTRKLFSEQKTTSEMNRKELLEEIMLFKNNGLNVNNLIVDYHVKLSFIFTPVIFILLGTPLSLGSKNNRIMNIIMMISLVFLYYLVFSLSRSFGSNSFIDPLLSAWIPHLIFIIISIILFIYREKFQGFIYIKFLKKYFSAFTMIIFIFSFSTIVNAYEIQISADKAIYNENNNEIKLLDNIKAHYKDIYLQTDEIIITGGNKTKDILDNIDKLNLPINIFSGCDHKEPHYYFKAAKTIIYPGDYLIAYNVILWELNGKIPIFYTPVMYLSLDDNNNFSFEFGYNNRRGAFLKTTYRYNLNYLPGEVYLDYYTISGFAGGFKQSVIYDENNNLSFKYLTQENKTDLTGLFNYVSEIDYIKKDENWNNQLNINYFDYDNYYKSTGKTYIRYNTSKQNLNYSLLYNDKNYENDNHFDNRDYNTNINYNYNFTNKLSYDLNLNADYIENKIDLDKSRVSGNTSFNYKGDKADISLIYDRYSPDFRNEDEDDNIEFEKKPELDITYRLPYNFNYNLTAGMYAENNNTVEGKRIKQEVVYNKSFYINKYLSLSTRQSANMTYFDTVTHTYDDYYNDYFDEYIDPSFFDITDTGYYYTYEPDYTAKLNITKNLNWDNSYKLVYRQGYTPFTFDNKDYSEIIDSSLNYNYNSFNANFSSGYDFDKLNYRPLKVKINYKKETINFAARTGYDFDTLEYDDLIIRTEYNKYPFNINSDFQYDLNIMQLEEADNEVIYELKDNFQLAINTEYDNIDKRFERAEVLLKKIFHCRQIWISYDYINEEYKVEYRLNLFPNNGFGIGQKENNLDFSIGDSDI